LFGAVVTEDFGQLRQMGRDLAERFGVGRPVNVFIANSSAKPSSPAATIGYSVGFHSSEKENWTPKELEFIMAHEIAHIKAGDCARGNAARSMIEQGAFGVAVVGLAQTFAQASFPVMAAGIGIASAGLLAARRLVKNYERHSIERCRDAEAVQKTGDLQSALSVMSKITPPGEIRNPPGILACLFSTHPPYRERVVNLCKAYYEAVDNGVIRPAAPPRASHSAGQAAFDRPQLSNQID
jgi:Zn-dependent protease with chaperone function